MIKINKAIFMTAVVTAFDENEILDVQANKNIYDHIIEGGTDGLVIMGSTGEFFSMSMTQRKVLIDLAIKHIQHRTKIFIGTGCISIDDTVELSNYALAAGADAVMIISPYYFSLSEESIELFYDSVACNVNGDIFLYNYPQITGHDLTAEITIRLIKKHKNIIGYKDTVTNMGHTRKLITRIRKEFPDFLIFSGYDENFAHNILSGGNGCIGALPNIYPEIFAQWANMINSGNFSKIAEFQCIVDKLMDIYSVGKPIIPIIKKAMMIRGISLFDYCTSPFIQANPDQTKQIKSIMKVVEKILNSSITNTI